MKNTPENYSASVYSQIKEILILAREKAYSAVNSAMVEAYWLIGKQIVEVQGNSERAGYGEQLLKYLSEQLTKDFGKGFDERELRKIRQFYLTFQIRDTVRPELSWSHYRAIMRVADEKSRNFYIEESIKANWSSRQLERQSRYRLKFKKQPHRKAQRTSLKILMS